MTKTHGFGKNCDSKIDKHTQVNNDKSWNFGSLGLSKRTFFANSWLQADNPLGSVKTDNSGESYTEIEGLLPPQGISRDLERFFIPGWKGESLFSKSALAVKKLKDQVWNESKTIIKKSYGFSRSIDLNILNEFHSFAKTLSERERELTIQIKTAADFWKNLHDKNSVAQEVIARFIDIYSFRVATVYFYKARFIIILCDKLGIPMDAKYFTNHNNFLMKVFQKGGSQDFVCESLRPNVYNWFSPSQEIAQKFVKVNQDILKLNVSQVMKMTSPQSELNTDMKFDDDQYSHAVSHKSFGLFVNSILIFFPLWEKLTKFEYPQKVTGFPKVLNTKFEGDHLRSLCHSHWLAQENNAHFKWSEILCSDFSNEEFGNSSFIKICQELQFLSFLARLAQYQGQEVQTMISSVMKAKYNAQKRDSNDQLNFLGQYDFNQSISYDKFVYNLHNLPKKNPHHYLVTQLNGLKDKISKEGYLLVSTNQKLFVPSQSQRVDQVLKSFKVIASFNFEKLEGKGEVCNYFYLLKKRNLFKEKTEFFKIDPMSLTSMAQTKEEIVHTFRWSGELSQFHQFESVTNGLKDFFDQKNSHSVSLYQKNLLANLDFEYHQDAVIEGKLLSNSNDSSDKVTHPQFFKNLTQSCLPFDHFFTIESLEEHDDQYSANFSHDLLGIDFRPNQKFSHVLVVDLRNTTNVILDIYPFDVYKAKKEELGNAFYQYFGLTQKIAHLNINLFREYFNSSIGKQVIQLTLNGGAKKIKSKLSTFLIPKVFGRKEDISSIDFKKLALFQSDVDELLRMHPDEINFQFEQSMSYLRRQQHETPWLVMGLLTHFKHNVTKAQNKVSGNSTVINKKDYRNPLISGPLQQLETYPLHPNDEVFLDFETSNRHELESPLAYVKTGIDEMDNQWIQLCSTNGPIAKLFAPTETIEFLEFLLSNVAGTQISVILKSLSLPKAEDIKFILKNFEVISETLENLNDHTQSLLQEIMTKNLNS